MAALAIFVAAGCGGSSTASSGTSPVAARPSNS